MIIYASRQYRTLDDFVGKPVWVRTRVRLNGRMFYSYIKVLSKDTVTNTTDSGYTYDVTRYTINQLDIKRLSRGGAMECTEAQKAAILNHTYSVSDDDVRILQPLEYLEDDDIFVITD